MPQYEYELSIYDLKAERIAGVVLLFNNEIAIEIYEDEHGNFDTVIIPMFKNL